MSKRLGKCPRGRGRRDLPLAPSLKGSTNQVQRPHGMLDGEVKYHKCQKSGKKKGPAAVLDSARPHLMLVPVGSNVNQKEESSANIVEGRFRHLPAADDEEARTSWRGEVKAVVSSPDFELFKSRALFVLA